MIQCFIVLGLSFSSGLFATDFIVTTKRGIVKSVNPKIFDELDPLKRTGAKLLEFIDGAVWGLAAHPFRQQIAFCGHSGIQLLACIEYRFQGSFRFGTVPKISWKSLVNSRGKYATVWPMIEKANTLVSKVSLNPL